MIRLHVIGLPSTQGSKTRMPNGHMVDGTSPRARANLGAWRQAVRAECRKWLGANPQAPLAEPVAVSLSFSFPATASNPHRFWHVSVPDVDKIIRSTLDALVQGAVLADDRYVCRVVADKAYCNPDEPAGCTVVVTSLAEDEEQKRSDRKQRAKDARKAARAAS